MILRLSDDYPLSSFHSRHYTILQYHTLAIYIIHKNVNTTEMLKLSVNDIGLVVNNIILRHQTNL